MPSHLRDTDLRDPALSLPPHGQITIKMKPGTYVQGCLPCFWTLLLASSADARRRGVAHTRAVPPRSQRPLQRTLPSEHSVHFLDTACFTRPSLLRYRQKMALGQLETGRI